MQHEATKEGSEGRRGAPGGGEGGGARFEERREAKAVVAVVVREEDVREARHVEAHRVELVRAALACVRAARGYAQLCTSAQLCTRLRGACTLLGRTPEPPARSSETQAYA